MAGHLFVIKGDLKKLACDAWALPTDDGGHVTAYFADAVGLEAAGWVPQRLEPGWVTKPFELDERIWLLNIGGFADTPAKQYADRAVKFVRQAASKLGSRNKHSRSKPLVAVNVVGSGEGGHGDEKGSIFRELVPALSAVVAEEKVECDVVLVAWNEGAYSAAQRVRRELLEGHPGAGWDELDENALATATRLAGEARRNRLVLFLGAGISASAGLPGWVGLLEALANDVGLDETQLQRLKAFDIRDQAEILSTWSAAKGEDLNAKVAKLLNGEGRYSLAHGLLASLSVAESVTTNFDQLFESACTAWDGAQLSVLPYQSASAGSPWLLKLHGSVHARDSITLTRTDYRNLTERYGALLGLVQALLFTRHMLFVGYSLSDEDFHEVVRQVRFARAGSTESQGEKFGTVVTLFDNPLLEILWPDMEITPVKAENEKPTPADLEEAGRRFEIFLDRLCLEAADLDRHLLDPAYKEMLDGSELELRAALDELQKRIGSVAASPTKEKIEELLRGFGTRAETT